MKRILAAMAVIIGMSTVGIGAKGEKEVVSIELEKDKPSVTGSYQTIYKNPSYFGKSKDKHFKVVIENKGENDIFFSLVNEASDNFGRDMANGLIKANKSKTLHFSLTGSKHSLNLTLARNGEEEGNAVGKIYTIGTGIYGSTKRLMEFTGHIHQIILKTEACPGHDKDEDYSKCLTCVATELLSE